MVGGSWVKGLVGMGVKERREREKEETRRKIVDAARVLFVEEGYEAVSMRKIAEAIEYSPAAVYVHFRDKEDLIREMCYADFERFDGEALRLGGIADPVERIRQIGRGYVEFGLANPHHYRLMFMTPPPAVALKMDEAKKAEVHDPSKSGYGLLKQAVREAVAGGRFRAEYSDADLAAQMLWAGVHGVTSLVIALAEDPCVVFHDVKGLVGMMTETLIRGMSVEEGDGVRGMDGERGAGKAQHPKSEGTSKDQRGKAQKKMDGARAARSGGNGDASRSGDGNLKSLQPSSRRTGANLKTKKGDK